MITHVNGKSVRTIAESAAELKAIGIGSPAELTIRRAGRDVLVTVSVTDIS